MNQPRVLVACEFTGTVRDAFTAVGFDATSCDLIDSETPGTHHTGDVRDILGDGWDLMIAHPPCTYLTYSGARWNAHRQSEQAEALDFIRLLLAAPIERIALENPDGIINSRVRRPDQVVQPYMFGHGETKATCFWLKNLPRLVATDRVTGRDDRIARMPRTATRGQDRSRTYPGIAAAMAQQWGATLRQAVLP